MTWQRARRPEQKDERRRVILESAATLFSERGYEGVSLSAIARRAGIAKSNLYSYFGTKEEIFLKIYLQDVGRWVEAAEGALAPHAGCNDPDLVARELAATVTARPRMASLLALLFGVLERNVCFQTVVEFNTALEAYAQRVVRLLQGVFPGLSGKEAVQFMMHMHALVIGLWPMGDPPEVVDQALERPEFAHLRVDFRSALEFALAALLRQSAQGRRPCGQHEEPRQDKSAEQSAFDEARTR